MRGILYPFRKAWGFIKKYIKVLLVFAAFLLLFISSYIIMDNTLSQKLSDHVEEAVTDMQFIMSSALNETKISLHHIADAIVEMIEHGDSFETIQAYMRHCSSDEYKEEIRAVNMSIFGYLEVFDAFYDGIPWDIPADYSPYGRPWYTNALDAGHEVAISKVYIDARLGLPVIFYSQALYDNGGRFLGVLATDVHIESLHQTITEGRRFTKGSYGAIMDEQLTLILHPHADIIGLSIANANSEVVQAAELIERDMNVWMYNFHDYQGIASLLFIRQIDNGWYILLTVPEGEYYKELYDMTAIIGILSLLMASALTTLLLRIDRARSDADMKSRQKSNFLAVMSHEIRTPMNAIMGIAEAQLQDDDETLPTGIKEAFDRIYYSGNLLLQIIGDILDLSKVEAGKLELITERYEVASLINEVIHINRIRFDSKPIEFKLSVDETIPASLIGDELRIKQILNNLLSNAFKYTWKGEVELSIKAEAGEGKDVILVFTVRDTGQGISPQDMQNLFDEYARFNVKANRSTVGTGLGLNITQNLVNLMRGEIFAESELEKGSTFTVRLPQKINGSSAVLGKELVDNLLSFRLTSVSQMKRQTVLREAMPYGSVLIVDDVEMNLFVAKLLMRPYKLNIDAASSGYEAIDRIKGGGSYDIIFMDHMMPKMDGVEAVEIIRNLGYTRPIIALTANAVAGQADLFLSNGFDDFISKPIDIRVLNAALNKHIRDRHRGQTDDPPLKAEKVRAEEGLPFAVPGLNVERGLDIFDGETEDYIAALQSFSENAPKAVAVLRDVTEETLPEYAINIHGLKSICGYICADDIQTKAQELEALAKEGELSAVLAQNEQFLMETEAFIKALDAALKDHLAR